MHTDDYSYVVYIIKFSFHFWLDLYMKVLAIETSCDDTSLAIVSSTNKGIFCDKIRAFHQIDLHSMYGGVVPELASREHFHQIIPVLCDLCKEFSKQDDIDLMMNDIDAIAVTDTPWLPWSLIVWRTAALFLSYWYDKPCQYVNHLHGHLVSWMIDRQYIDFNRSLILSVSWWHSDLSILSFVDKKNILDVYMDTIWQFSIKKIASTRDDAIGEVFDKVSRLLWWPYPGWVWISQQANLHDRNLLEKKYPFVIQKFKRIILSDTYDFSFSGMKSQAYNFISQYRTQLWLKEENSLPQEIISYLSYEFQEAVSDILVTRILQLIKEENINIIALVGGVSANIRIREKIKQMLLTYENNTGQKITFYTPLQFDYCTDNAAMIGAVTLLSMRV